MQAPLHASQPCTCRPCQHTHPCQPTGPHLEPASRPGPPWPAYSQPPTQGPPGLPAHLCARVMKESMQSSLEKAMPQSCTHREAPLGSFNQHECAHYHKKGSSRRHGAGRADGRVVVFSRLQQHVRPVDSRHQRPVRNGHTLGGACERGEDSVQEPQLKVQCSATQAGGGRAHRCTAQRSTAWEPTCSTARVHQAGCSKGGRGGGQWRSSEPQTSGRRQQQQARQRRMLLGERRRARKQGLVYIYSSIVRPAG